MCALLNRGLTVADMDRMTFGNLLDYIFEYDRCVRRANGENVRDPEEYYRRLKKIEPIVLRKLQAGEITPEKFAEWVTPIRQYEGW